MGKKRRRQVTGLTEAERIKRGKRITIEVAKETTKEASNAAIHLFQRMIGGIRR